MKYSSHTLAICALLGSAAAIKDYYYDDQAKYDDNELSHFMEKTNKIFNIIEEPKKVAPQAVPIKPVEAPKPAAPAPPKPQVKKEEKPVEQMPQQAAPSITDKVDKSTLPQAPTYLSESELTAENLAKKDIEIETSNNMSDVEYLQQTTANELKFAFFIKNIQGPEDLTFLQTQAGKKKGWHGRRITDMDGDGIEDNEKFSQDTLDEFYDPLVFGVSEDINNTHHGNLPGHKQLWFTMSESEPPVHWQEIEQHNW